MSAQHNAIVAGAELIFAQAQEAGERCNLPHGVAATRIIECAFGIAIARMIGPNAPVDRIQEAIRISREKIAEQTLVMHAYLYSPAAIGDGR